MVGLGADGVLAVGIENHEIGVAADGDGALARVKSEELGGSGCDQFDKAIHVEASLSDAARVHETHAVLDSRTPVGDFGEVADAEFFLFLEAKRTVIRGYDLQVIVLQSLPQFFLVPLFA